MKGCSLNITDDIVGGGQLQANNQVRRRETVGEIWAGVKEEGAHMFGSFFSIDFLSCLLAAAGKKVRINVVVAHPNLFVEFLPLKISIHTSPLRTEVLACSYRSHLNTQRALEIVDRWNLKSLKGYVRK